MEPASRNSTAIMPCGEQALQSSVRLESRSFRELYNRTLEYMMGNVGRFYGYLGERRAASITPRREEQGQAAAEGGDEASLVPETSGRYDAGYVGNRELSAGTRVLFINGICYSMADNVRLLSMMSEHLGSLQIYYQYNPTNGFSRDITNIVAGLSPYRITANRLAMCIDQHLHELRMAPEQRLVILTHSGGSRVVHDALRLTDFRQRAALAIYTFGAYELIRQPHYLPPLADICNFVHRSDPVPFLCNPLVMARALFRGSSNVQLIGQFLRNPFLAHAMASPGYQQAVEAILQRFNNARRVTTSSPITIEELPEETSQDVAV